MEFEQEDVIKLLDVIPADEKERDKFTDVYLVMQKMDTTLKHVIKSKQKLTNEHYLFFIYQTLRGLNYIHSSGVVHRDLKPENILVDLRNCNVKICDFGLGRGVSSDEKLTEYVTTRWYRAPEIMVSACEYDCKVDIWSLGCIFSELILRRVFFPGSNHMEQLMMIFTIIGTNDENGNMETFEWIKQENAKEWVQSLGYQKGKNLHNIFSNVSHDAQDLIIKLLILNPYKRISVEDAINHPYFREIHQNNKNTIKTCNKKFTCDLPYNNEFSIRHRLFTLLDDYSKSMNEKFKTKVKLHEIKYSNYHHEKFNNSINHKTTSYLSHSPEQKEKEEYNNNKLLKEKERLYLIEKQKQRYNNIMHISPHQYHRHQHRHQHRHNHHHHRTSPNSHHRSPASLIRSTSHEYHNKRHSPNQQHQQQRRNRIIRRQTIALENSKHRRSKPEIYYYDREGHSSSSSGRE